MFEKANGITSSIGIPLRMGNPNFAQRLAIECMDFPAMFKTPTPPAMTQGAMQGAPMGGPMPEAQATLQGAPIDTGASLDMGAPTTPPPMAAGQAPVEAIQ